MLLEELLLEPSLEEDVDELEDVDFDLSPPELLVDEYRSAYQPPPFRMKFPPLIWRFAVL